jgi:hypothetical protein
MVVAAGNPLGIGSPDDLGRDDLRAVAAPAGWATAPAHVARVAAVAGGHADCALAGTRAARAAGLETRPAGRGGRGRITLATRPGASRRDPTVRGPLELLAGALRREGNEPLGGAGRAA